MTIDELRDKLKKSNVASSDNRELFTLLIDKLEEMEYDFEEKVRTLMVRYGVIEGAAEDE